MIRATELAGRAVVDIEGAEKVGSIDKIILDPDRQRVAGFVVSRAGSSFASSKTHVLIPSTAVHSIGPDAVTIRQSAVAGSDTARLEALPRGSDMIGRKVVSEDGRFLGKVSDVLIDRAEGQIVGYLLSDHTPGGPLQELMGKEKRRRDNPYLPANSNLRTGRDLIVASEDAVSYDWTDTDVEAPPSGTPVTRWGYKASNLPVEEDAVVAGGLPSDVDGIDTGRETNPRVR